MTSSHTLNFPVFDETSAWSGVAVLLKTPHHLLFIKRSLTMPTHAGQIAFFGGHKKAEETHPFQVAQREFSEESGFSCNLIHCYATLAPVKTSRLQSIVPVVADLLIPVEDFLSRARSNGEWSDLFAVPWREINQEQKWGWGSFHGLTEHRVLFMPIGKGRYLHYANNSAQTHLLWGATASMVWNYLSLHFRSQTNF